LKKSTFAKITYIYFSIVVIALTIYVLTVAGPPDWQAPVAEQKHNLLLFAGLLFIGMVLISIETVNYREKGDKEQKSKKSAVYSGLSLAVVFLVWRLLMGIF
jgi:cell division protein FtsW (lipid II flippase)